MKYLGRFTKVGLAIALLFCVFVGVQGRASAQFGDGIDSILDQIDSNPGGGLNAGSNSSGNPGGGLGGSSISDIFNNSNPGGGLDANSNTSSLPGGGLGGGGSDIGGAIGNNPGGGLDKNSNTSGNPGGGLSGGGGGGGSSDSGGGGGSSSGGSGDSGDTSGGGGAGGDSGPTRGTVTPKTNPSKHGEACELVDPAKAFLGLPRWYEYLEGERDIFGKCTPVVDISTDGFNAILPIALAIVDILLRIAGLVAVFAIIYSGFEYIRSQGEPDKTTRAKDGIINALVGMGIVIVSSAVVAFIGFRLK